MARIVGSILLGYLVIVVAVLGLMTAAWFALGPAGAFHPGSWEVTPAWIVLSLIISLVAAVAGGYAAAAVALDSRGPMWLAVWVVVLGIIVAIPMLTSPVEPPPGPRPDVLAMFEAMQKAQPPFWLALLNPIIGFIGVLIGGRLRRTSRA